jgi:hypothetical protein
VSLPLRLHRLQRYEVNHLLCERVVCGACFPDKGGSGGLLAVRYDGGGSFFPSNLIFTGGRCSFNVQVASRSRFQMLDFVASSSVDAGGGV